jgi:hypothetical protein
VKAILLLTVLALGLLVGYAFGLKSARCECIQGQRAVGIAGVQSFCECDQFHLNCQWSR